MKVAAFFFSLVFFLAICAPIYAQENKSLPVITVINPIRGNSLGLEKINLLTNLTSQWQITKNENIHATWLWQYSALADERLVNFAKTQMHDQEFGLFLEIDRNSAAKAGTQYRGQGPWYFSDGLLLVSYDKREREKLIDSAFTLFKNKFGYYPKTVGAWWIGADSLLYMQKKYGIVAAMRAADQFDLDVYSLWGTPWSIPYIASKENEGLPANSHDNSHVVILQWAARDPTSGYADATYSLQDFALKGYNFSYFDYLAGLFLKQPLDNLVIGLENSGGFDNSESGYGLYLKKAKQLESTGKVQILLAKDYAEKFLSAGNTFAKTHYFLTKAYTSEDQSFWYMSENYRAGIQKLGKNIYLLDLRDYSKKTTENFSYLPNSQGYLRVNIPPIIDSRRNPAEKKLLASTVDSLSIIKQDKGVLLLSGKQKIALFTNTTLTIFPENRSQQTFEFTQQAPNINVFAIVFTALLIYFLFVLIRTKNIKKSLKEFCLQLIPLFFAYPFLSAGQLGNMYYLFDRKELVLFAVLPVLKTLSLNAALLFFQVVPFVLLIIFHLFFVLKASKKRYKIIYYFFLGGLIYLYSHVAYFPLDKSTYAGVLVIFIVIFLVLTVISFIILRKTGSKKLFSIALAAIPLILLLVAGTIYFSRTKLVLTPFESEALSFIRQQGKAVLFISESDYGISPIYKAVKPVLYENYRMGEKLTGTHWEILEKQKGFKLSISDAQALIVVPRYLGADLSESDAASLGAKKIFDNAQIAIFQKK